MKASLNFHRFFAILMAFAAVMALATGCQDPNFPDPNNPTSATASVQNLASGVEASIRTDMGFYYFTTAIYGREAYYLDGADPAWIGYLVTGKVDPGGAFLNRTWNARYAAIANCRGLYDRAATLSVAADKAGAQGFAATMWAQQLLLNLNLTYDNGVKIVYSDDRSLPFASKEASFAEIARLLDEGYSALQSAQAAGDKFPFALSSGFAGFDKPSTYAKVNRAFRARAAAYTKDYAAASSALAASFLDEQGDLKKGAYQVYSTASGDARNPVYEPPAATSVKFVAHNSFVTDAEAGDKRVSTKTVKRETVSLGSGAAKLSSDYGVTVSQSNVDPLPIIRNEELILLKAEVALFGSTPNYAEGTRLLNIVRKAAGLTDLPTLTSANATDALLKERRYSLFVEGGHRWIDARRFGKLGSLPNDRAGDASPTSLPKPDSEVVPQ